MSCVFSHFFFYICGGSIRVKQKKRIEQRTAQDKRVAYIYNICNSGRTTSRSLAAKEYSSLNRTPSRSPVLVRTCIVMDTTAERKFPECSGLSRVPNIGHSGKKLFLECCTRGRNALWEESLPRVPNSPWHSGKRGTRGKPLSPSATLEEERHQRTKNNVGEWRYL
jgi:hypothetical protein